MPRPEVGDAAPEFELQDTDSQTVRLRDLRGKKVVLYFYPRDDTPGCTVEACSFRDNIGALTEAGALVYGVSTDDVASHGKFTSKFDLNFPLLADTERTTVQDYGVWVERKRFGRTSMGIQRATFLIDEEGRIAKVWATVKPELHVAQVLEAVAT